MGLWPAPLAAGIFYAYSMKEFPALRQVLQPSFAFALAWGLAGLYFLNRGMWSAVTPGDVGLNTGLEVCRLEIERQRDLVRRLLVWSFGPVMLAIATFILALAMVSTRERGIIPNGLPFLIVAGCLDSLVVRDQVARTARVPARDRRTEGYRDGEP